MFTLGGVCSRGVWSQGVSAPGGGGCLLGGLSAPGGSGPGDVCSRGGGFLLPGGWGMSALRGVWSLGGGIPACTEADPPCEQNE